MKLKESSPVFPYEPELLVSEMSVLKIFLCPKLIIALL